MSIFEKLKNLNKKWYLLLVTVLVIGAGSGAAAKYYYRQQFEIARQANIGLQTVRVVDMDLLYLENTSTTKLSPGQAKAILPLIEKLPTANASSSPTATDLTKQIYENLSPVQYQALTEHGKLSTGNDYVERRDDKKGHGVEDNHDFRNVKANDKGIGDSKAEALNNIVGKMLKERSAETPASQSK